MRITDPAWTRRYSGILTIAFQHVRREKRAINDPLSPGSADKHRSLGLPRDRGLSSDSPRKQASGRLRNPRPAQDRARSSQNPAAARNTEINKQRERERPKLASARAVQPGLGSSRYATPTLRSHPSAAASARERASELLFSPNEKKKKKTEVAASRFL